MNWFLIKALFSTKVGFKSILRKQSKETLEEWCSKAIADDNYELAALLKYYIEFKFTPKIKA